MFRPILKTFVLSLGLMLNSYALAELPTQQAVQTQLDSAKKLDQADADNKALVQTLEDTLAFLAQIDKQKADNQALNKSIQDSQKALKTSQHNLEKLKEVTIASVDNLTQKATTDLQKELTSTQSQLETVQ
ncbi:TPA: mechanosensitive channel MscK, partial [Mannheimia haemolytica]|nr:mechanosensitive channel MscK [Mannheimia haemolytica]